jgi:hypothetical protein
LVREWVEECLKPIVSSNCLLLLDSWKGQKDIGLFSSLEEIGLELQFIPEKTTYLCQPLDVYGFRQWKLFIRKITNHIAQGHTGIDIDISLRSNIIIMQSLIMNQLSAPIFKTMWEYAWYKAGYSNERPHKFENVNEVVFEKSMRKCASQDCVTFQFLKCSHCRTFLCFHHFYVAYHFHEDDDMSQEAE